jgi:cytochrome c-type biogenesis protein
LAWLSRAAGVVVILLGLHLTGLVRLPFVDREYAARPKGSPGLLAPFLFGASFAVAWTPCVGPILGSTLALAASQPASAAFPLLLAYYLDLGAPFLLVGLFPSRAFAVLKRHRRWAGRLHVAFGFVLIGMGVLVFTNKLALLANFRLLNEVLL